jgi:CheY-like chemotaxis protein
MSEYVLVVDDHPEVRRLIIDVLQYLEIEGRAVGSGEEAVALVKADPPLAIVLDLMMPGMDGFSTITRLHREAKGKPTPIILLSAIALDDERLIGLPGVMSVIRKDNFTVDTFGRLLDPLLKKKPVVESHPDDDESPIAKLKPGDEDEPVAKSHPDDDESPIAKLTPAAADEPVAESHPDDESPIAKLKTGDDESRANDELDADSPPVKQESKPLSQPQPDKEAKTASGEAKDQ